MTSFLFFLVWLSACDYCFSQSAQISTVTYFNLTDCLAFIAQKIELLNTYTVQSIVLPPGVALDPAKSSCTTSGSTIGFEYSNVGEIAHMVISLAFAASQQNWIVSASSINITCNANSKTCVNVPNGRFDLDWMVASIGMGFKCVTPPILTIYNPDSSATSQALRITWLQVQPLDATEGRFDDALDCVGFFTIPVWSTLVISFLLIGILTYGLRMLMSVKPFELFDDPKTKPIQLGAAN